MGRKRSRSLATPDPEDRKPVELKDKAKKKRKLDKEPAKSITDVPNIIESATKMKDGRKKEGNHVRKSSLFTKDGKGTRSGSIKDQKRSSMKAKRHSSRSQYKKRCSCSVRRSMSKHRK